MGLMDRVKQQASQIAQQANESMAKLDNLPAQRRADMLLRSLGVAVLAEKTGRAAADNDAQITRILADIEQHERQYNVDLVQQGAQAQQVQQPWQPGPPGQPWQQGPGQPGQPGQQWQQPPGDFLTSAPPADQNVPSAPGPAQGGYGGAPGQGGAPGYGGAPGGQPMSGPHGWNQQGGQIGSSAFPPSASLPDATAQGQAPDAENEPGEQGQQNFFPPSAGV
jgi:hypothetical protein